MTSSLQLSNYTQIPNVVFDHWIEKLSDEQFLVLVVIYRLCGSKEDDFTSIEEIAKRCPFYFAECEDCIDILQHFDLIKINDKNEVRLA